MGDVAPVDAMQDTLEGVLAILVVLLEFCWRKEEQQLLLREIILEQESFLLTLVGLTQAAFIYKYDKSLF